MRGVIQHRRGTRRRRLVAAVPRPGPATRTRRSGQLPPTTKEVRQILEGYDTALLLGDKIDTFTFTGDQAVPGIGHPDHPATARHGFDCSTSGWWATSPRTMDALAKALGSTRRRYGRRPASRSPRPKYPASGPRLGRSDPGRTRATRRDAGPRRDRGLVEDDIVQDMAVTMGFRNVYFSPRARSGLGDAPICGADPWRDQAVCFVGDGGSMFSLQPSTPPPRSNCRWSSSCSSTTSTDC